METKQLTDIETKINFLLGSLRKIDEMIRLSKTDNTIDVDDLRKERRNCAIAIKKLKKSAAL